MIFNRIPFRQRRQSLVVAFTAATTAAILLIILTFFSYIFINGIGFFWPSNINQINYQLQDQAIQTVYVQGKIKQNSPLNITGHSEPAQNKNIVLQPRHIIERGQPDELAEVLLYSGRKRLARVVGFEGAKDQQLTKDPKELLATYTALKYTTEQLSRRLEQVLLQELAEVQKALATLALPTTAKDAVQKLALMRQYRQLNAAVGETRRELAGYQILLDPGDRQTVSVPINDVAQLSFPNSLGWSGKVWHWMKNVGRFIADDPQRTNSRGGVFPALFGTVLMVLIMTILVTPLGVVAAIYLHEYAPVNRFTSIVRSSVNNLASVPSIVYGVFGLGLLVYHLGTSVDELFFSDRLPTPTFGAPGLFWAALTMAILTLPVVIVAAEEGLRQVPDSLRKASFALGATRAETIWHTTLPIASPGIMTGVILAIARGAGEVAPIILVGAVKFAPALPIDGDFPFVHFERQFMHLGVLVYDGAFHGSHLDQNNGFMFAVCLLLLMLVLVLNMLAVVTRTKLRRRYAL